MSISESHFPWATLCQSRPYPYARVDPNPMPESTLFTSQGLLSWPLNFLAVERERDRSRIRMQQKSVYRFEQKPAMLLKFHQKKSADNAAMQFCKKRIPGRIFYAFQGIKN
jgi:hypothetical protein